MISVITVITAFPASAAVLDDDFDTDVNISVPDDAWKGKSTEFKNKDGSITEIYDNGSVWTTYKDGTSIGIDYNGNKHTEAKDGTYTVNAPNGASATQYNDGRMSYTDAGSTKTTTYNKDGSYTESYSSWGVSIDYNSDGEKTGIGFTDSKERLGIDDDGAYKNGTVKGKNGEKFTVSDGKMELTASDGRKAEFAYSGGDGTKESFNITHPDGYKTEWDVTSKWQRGINGDLQEVVENTGNIVYPDGARFDYNEKMTFDDDGNPVFSNNNVAQFTGADGSTLWVDKNSNAMNYNDKNGNKFVVDKDGNLLENKTDEIDFKATYDENGNLTSADIKYKDGAKMTQNPDGSGSFTLPDGTKYTSDGKGNVYKDDEPIKKDGEWMPGYGSDAEKKDGPITENEIIGTWSIRAVYSDMDSPLVTWLRSLFDGIFGEGAGNDIVESGIDEDKVMNQTLVIEKRGSTLYATLTSDGDVSVYTGTFRNGTLKLKYKSGSSDDDDFAFGVQAIEYKFVRIGNSVIMEGSFKINTYVLKANYSYKGTKR